MWTALLVVCGIAALLGVGVAFGGPFDDYLVGRHLRDPEDH